MSIDLTNCAYSAVHDAAISRGLNVWFECDDEDWGLCWKDDASKCEEVLEAMSAGQKLNHIPGMHMIARKTALAQRIYKMHALFPAQYHFLPETWLLPNDLLDFRDFMQDVQTRGEDGASLDCYIAKPESSSDSQPPHLKSSVDCMKLEQPHVVQSYVAKPLRVRGVKFDVRLFVLLLSCEPLQVMIYEDGLVTMASEPYEQPSRENLHCTGMHLPSTTRVPSHPEKNGIQIHESLASVFTSLADAVIGDKLWTRMEDLVVKTLISVQPWLLNAQQQAIQKQKHRPKPPPIGSDRSQTSQAQAHLQSPCFELLTFDVLIDETLQPWLLQVHQSPRLQSQSSLHQKIIESMVAEVFGVVTDFQAEATRPGGDTKTFRPVYPSSSRSTGGERYKVFMEAASGMYEREQRMLRRPPSSKRDNSSSSSSTSTSTSVHTQLQMEIQMQMSSTSKSSRVGSRPSHRPRTSRCGSLTCTSDGRAGSNMPPQQTQTKPLLRTHSAPAHAKRSGSSNTNSSSSSRGKTVHDKRPKARKATGEIQRRTPTMSAEVPVVDQAVGRSEGAGIDQAGEGAEPDMLDGSLDFRAELEALMEEDSKIPTADRAMHASTFRLERSKKSVEVRAGPAAGAKHEDDEMGEEEMAEARELLAYTDELFETLPEVKSSSKKLARQRIAGIRDLLHAS